MRKKLGEALLELGLITPRQLSEALELQRRRGLRLGAALVQCGHLDETRLAKVLSDLLQIRVVDLSRVQPDRQALEMVKHGFAAENDLFPYEIKWERGRATLTVAMSDPMNYRVIDELGFITNANIEPVLARPSDVDAAIRKYYGPKPPAGYAPVRLDSQAGMPTMTIVRRGGGEETINTSTGEIESPFIKKKDTDAPANGPAKPGAPLDDTGAVLLTEEVPPDSRVDAVGRPAVPPHLAVTNQPVPQRPDRPIPLTAVKQRPNVGRDSDTDPYFNEALGALIDRAGEAVNAQSFVRLERRFWALMRLLAKKGILTNEDFLRELGEEEDLR